VVSPVLANLFLHWAFDAWMDRESPDCPFERYADDGLVHCKSQARARQVLAALERSSPSGGRRVPAAPGWSTETGRRA
jgi:retron-type reverse transcriptase